MPSSEVLFSTRAHLERTNVDVVPLNEQPLVTDDEGFRRFGDAE
jgi:hypothetical protein